MNWQFEIYQTGAHSWAWKLRRPNGVMVCMSDESYKSVGEAEEAIVEMRNLPTNVKIVDMDSPAEVKKRGGGKPGRKVKPLKDKPTQREIDEKKAEKK